MKLGKIEIKIIKERIKKRIIKTKTKNIRNRNRYKKINTNQNIASKKLKEIEKKK